MNNFHMTKSVDTQTQVCAETLLLQQHLEHEDQADDVDDDGVHVAGGEGGLQSSNGRIAHHTNGD